MPEGAAAPMGLITGTARSFAAAMESNIAKTRADESYKVFKELCGTKDIYVGFRKNDPRAASEAENAEDPGNRGPYAFWMIVPSPDGRYATVEFAEANTATFVYRTNGNFQAFAVYLNRAMEAISFKREVIRLTDEELLRPENVSHLMAAKRTASLQFIRNNFVARVIHSSPESWKRKIIEIWESR
jgi:PHD/YefM family antitoxin component YafN of YafNO toxin-antitoxin module